MKKLETTKKSTEPVRPLNERILILAMSDVLEFVAKQLSNVRQHKNAPRFHLIGRVLVNLALELRAALAD